MSGAKEDVSKNRKAACPFGVAILGIFVPVLTACLLYTSDAADD